MTAYCGHQTTTSGDILVSHRRGVYHCHVQLVVALPALIVGQENLSHYNPYTF